MKLDFKDLHPIVLLNYPPRISGHFFIFIVVMSYFIGEGKLTPLIFSIALAEGLIWPHLALFESMNSANPKKLEIRFLFLDALFVGMWIAYMHFALWPSTLFVTAIFMACLSVQGLKLGVLSLVGNVIGALIICGIFGFQFNPDSSFFTTVLCMFGFIMFPSVMGYMTYLRALTARTTKIKLRTALNDLDHINRVLHEASSSLQLDRIMQVIVQSLLERFFKFDTVTVQSLNQETKELIFRTVYDEILPTYLIDEISKIKLKLEDQSLITLAFQKNKVVHIPTINESMLSPLDKFLRKLIGYVSVLHYPLVIKDRVIGVISFYSRQPIELNDAVFQALTTQITQVSLIINNAILYDQIKTKRAEITQKNRQLQDVSNQLAKYISPQLFEKIMQGDLNIRVGSNKKRLTIFFSDIVGFTELSDRIESEELTTMLNTYLDAMTKIALRHGGTIDKYIGDAIMVFFGDPETKGIKYDAINCAKMAIDMRETIHSLKTSWEEMGISEQLLIKIGINTGYCAVGNFGSDFRMDYTVIGSTVNLASRLLSSANPGDIMVSHETYLLIKDAIQCEEAGVVHMKGIGHPVKIYRILAAVQTAPAS